MTKPNPRYIAEVRISTIYRELAKGQSSAESSILRSITTHPLITVPYALSYRSYFLAWISFVSFLAEVLIVTLGSVPYSDTELYTAFTTSTYISIAILGTMFLSLIAVAIWRRENPRLPREPTTLGSVWTYLCGSSLTYSFGHLGGLSDKEMEREIRSMDQRYFLARVPGIDKVQRWTIDEICEEKGTEVIPP